MPAPSHRASSAPPRGARLPVIIAMRAEYFSPRSYETIMGFSSLVVTGGSIAGPLLAGLSFDTTGSYAIGFTGLAMHERCPCSSRPPEWKKNDGHSQWGESPNSTW